MSTDPYYLAISICEQLQPQQSASVDIKLADYERFNQGVRVIQKRVKKDWIWYMHQVQRRGSKPITTVTVTRLV